jgi:hypothetical protein
MCSVSVVQDYMRREVAPNQWTRPMFNEYKEILKRLEALDERLGQADCEDPAKATWMREVEDRLKALEA